MPRLRFLLKHVQHVHRVVEMRGINRTESIASDNARRSPSPVCRQIPSVAWRPDGHPLLSGVKHLADVPPDLLGHGAKIAAARTDPDDAASSDILIYAYTYSSQCSRAASERPPRMSPRNSRAALICLSYSRYRCYPPEPRDACACHRRTHRPSRERRRRDRLSRRACLSAGAGRRSDAATALPVDARKSTGTRSTSGSPTGARTSASKWSCRAIPRSRKSRTRTQRSDLRGLPVRRHGDSAWITPSCSSAMPRIERVIQASAQHGHKTLKGKDRARSSVHHGRLSRRSRSCSETRRRLRHHHAGGCHRQPCTSPSASWAVRTSPPIHRRCAS